jgi:outer membrane lipoprotein LolB
MSGDENTVTLDVDDKTYQDTDASYLIWRITGWQIPVEQFPMWVKGQHQDQAEVITSQQGWVTQIKPNCNKCDNWLINYDNYKLVKNNWLPHNIVLNNTSNNSQLIIRVNSWR